MDASEALALPGVAAVATGADADVAAVWLEATSALASHVRTRQPVLAWPKVRFAAEAVAAVVGGDRYVAEDAAELVTVDYQERPVAVDAVRALAGAGVALHWRGLASSALARDHHYNVTAGFDDLGQLQAIWARIVCNVGAYSVYPWTAGLEPLIAGGLLTGPYNCPNYDCEVFGAATNIFPTGPYRGVARPATTFVMERLLDIGSQALGLDPVDVRRVNLIAQQDLP